MMSIPVPVDNGFDAVVSSDVIEHLQNVDNYLKEIKRVVKRGGVVIISTPIRYTEKPLDKMHAIEFFPEEFKRLIKAHFPNSEFFESHPIFWMEFLNRSIYFRILLNILSFIKNPFEGFGAKFRYNTLQYSVSFKEG